MPCYAMYIVYTEYWYLAVLGNITCKYSTHISYMFVYHIHIYMYLIEFGLKLLPAVKRGQLNA